MTGMAERTRLITTGEAARVLGINPATLGKWAAAGKVIPTERTIGGHLRWDLADLRRQIREAQRDD